MPYLSTPSGRAVPAGRYRPEEEVIRINQVSTRARRPSGPHRAAGLLGALVLCLLVWAGLVYGLIAAL
jgi:hypothetical protein